MMAPKKIANLHLLTLIATLFLLGLVNVSYSVGKGEDMEFKQDSIENIRVKYERALIGINGVVSVSTGLNKKGKICLKIGTSIPIEQVYSKLPEELNKSAIELEYVGDVQAQ